jgi:uncharacterized membrane protein YphA (DoxX/SURF4 family)
VNRDSLARTAKVMGPWLPALLLVVVFVGPGLAKFSDSSGWAAAFRHWGYPRWFRVSIGVIELSAVACLLSGRLAVYGAILIVWVMLGAMATHVVYDHGRHLESEVVPLALAILLLVLRRRDLRAWVWRQSPASVRPDSPPIGRSL